MYWPMDHSDHWMVLAQESLVLLPLKEKYLRWKLVSNSSWHDQVHWFSPSSLTVPGGQAGSISWLVAGMIVVYAGWVSGGDESLLKSCNEAPGIGNDHIGSLGPFMIFVLLDHRIWTALLLFLSSSALEADVRWPFTMQGLGAQSNPAFLKREGWSNVQ